MKTLHIQLPAPPGGVSLSSDGEGDRAPDGAQGAPQGEKINRRLHQQVKDELESLRRARAALEQACRQVQNAHEEFAAHAEEQLLDLAVEIAAKVLMQEIRAERYEIEPIVRQVLDKAPTGASLTVLLNPSDLERCGKIDPPTGAGEIIFKPEASVPPGGCRVDTPDGLIQTDPAEHLVEIAQTLKRQE